jgi:putative iron-regulated protein
MDFKSTTLLTIATLGLAVTTGCQNNIDKGLALMPDAAMNYATNVHKSYEDSVTTATTLDTAVKALVANPSASTLKAAQDAWLASREPYLQTEVYRFYEGPIDNETDGPEGLLNAWPMDESHVDYTTGQMGLSNSGIVNDTSVTIDAATLESKNEEGGEENVATGYHAVEFLLWGQDMSAEGPGSRSFTDYVDRGAAGSFGCYDPQSHMLDCEAMSQDECAAGTIWAENACAINADRRGQYISTASEMMVGHLNGLVAAWNSDGGNYRADFEAAIADE